MGSSILRCIYRTGATGIFSLNSYFVSKLRARMMSTMISSSALRSRTSPWLMLPPAAFDVGDMVYNFYSLAENQVLSINKKGGGGGGDGEVEEYLADDDNAKFVGSSHGWLALFNQHNGDLFLSNPVSRRHIKLPPILTLPNPEINLRYCRHGSVSKVIISCSPDDDGDEECRAMMAFGPQGRLAFCRPGHSTEWTPIGNLFHEDEDGEWPRTYTDFVYSSRQKRFLCITKFDDLEAWDLRDPQCPRIDWMSKLESDEDDDEDNKNSDHEDSNSEALREVKYLIFAEQSNQFYLVTRYVVERMGPDGCYVKDMYYGGLKGWDDSYPYKTIDFRVHKIDRYRDDDDGSDGGGGGGKMRYIEGSLDGLVMFIGINHSFALRAAEFPELKPNSIYFTDDKEFTPPDYLNKGYGGHDIGVFDYENKTFSACYYPCDVQSIKKIAPAPLWFTPSLPH